MFTRAERLISLRNLRPKKKEGFLKVISIFSFLGIMLGVAILIIVMSVMNGFKTDLTKKILGLNPHVVIQPNSFQIDKSYISRLVGAIIEANYNKDIMKWPKSISPFDVVIIPSISKNNKENLEKAEKVYKKLKKQNIDVLLDDVDENMSNKFKKHDLIGVPYQIIIGSKSDGDNFEFKELNSQSEILNLDKIQLKLKS